MSAEPGKYARVERERRFLLSGEPDPGTVTARRTINDRYLDHTRLRLRAIHLPDAGRWQYKLTQKIPADPDTRCAVQGTITTAYLDAAEYWQLARLPATRLTKRRLSVPPYGVDVFEGPLSGLVLAEVEFDSDDECRAFVPSSPGGAQVVAEVTADPRFTGGRLAATTEAQLTDLLRQFLPRS